MAHSAEVRVSVADLEPIKRLLAGVERMKLYEDAGGDGWWSGWDEVKAAVADLQKAGRR